MAATPGWLAMTEKLSLVEKLSFRTFPRFYGKSPGLTAGRIVGDCCRPWILPGDLVLIDTCLDPEHGELVMVNMRYRRPVSSSGFMVGGGTTYRYEKAIKQLLIVDGVQYLACATGAVPADAGHEILGPIVAFSRRGWRREPMTNIDFSLSVEQVTRRSA